MRHRNEFSSEDVTSFLFTTSVNYAERSGTNFFENIVIIVDRFAFNVDRLWDVFRVDVEDYKNINVLKM